MATSKCASCGSFMFETKEVTPSNSNFKLTFVQCAMCGGVVGVLDFFNIGQLIHDLARKLRISL